MCIVGAGFTGLWTAYWLKQLKPSLDVLIVESERVGFGASGRNGGWLSGKMVGSRGVLAREPSGRDGVIALHRACIRAVDEVLEFVEEHDLDVDAVKGGYLQVARTNAEVARLDQLVAEEQRWGISQEDLRVLGPGELRARLNISRGLAASFSPHNARIHPAKLVQGLARVVEASGVTIAECTPATELTAGSVSTTRGTVSARVVLRATEAYTARLAGWRREVLPMTSAMVATRPLAQSAWDRIGWNGYEGLCATQHTYFYAQRTADGRIALGGRGLPYRFASRVDDNGRVDRHTRRHLRATLADLFPDIDLSVDHVWCGVLGVPRDWSPSVTYNPATGLGHAGGYAGQGVTASYLAGRTLADLVTGANSALVKLPWTNRASRTWEPEPLRWAGAYSVYGLSALADGVEGKSQNDRTSRFAELATLISGHR